MSKVRLLIADTVIEAVSRHPLLEDCIRSMGMSFPDRYLYFIYRGTRKPDIRIKVKLVEKLPALGTASPVFVTFHHLEKRENWRLYKRGNQYLFFCPLADKRQLMVINRDFSRVTAYVGPSCQLGMRSRQGMHAVKARFGEDIWSIADLIYDFLQVLMINYLAAHNRGVFTHAVGIEDVGGRGMLFCGKSGAGKSTTAALWHAHSKARVLNDDRIIVIRRGSRYLMHCSPWFGTYEGYLTGKPRPAELTDLFLLEQRPHNSAVRIKAAEGFARFYPALFPAFWEKRCLQSTSRFCLRLLKDIGCWRLGFVKNRSMISFVRRVVR